MPPAPPAEHFRRADPPVLILCPSRAAGAAAVLQFIPVPSCSSYCPVPTLDLLSPGPCLFCPPEARPTVY